MNSALNVNTNREPSTRKRERTALITGASSGIGEAFAEVFAAEGFDLAICGQRQESEVESLEGLRKPGVQVLYARADVAKAEDRAAFLSAIKARFGRLDVLVNNAGIAPKVRADILEVGTPLLKAEGAEAVRQLRKEFPHHVIVADTKTNDAGRMEMIPEGADKALITITATAWEKK